MQQFNDLLPVIIIAIVLWIGGLSFALYWVFAHYKKLGKGVRAGNLIKVLEGVMESEREGRSRLTEVERVVNEIKKEGLLHIQNVGLVRYNPFSEIGGDQSFSLCLLDGNKTGFVITCLHTRDRTRVYAKPVGKGVSKYELSREERKAIEEARKKR